MMDAIAASALPYAASMWLLISMLLYFMINGAGLFETFVLIPKWTRKPPDSLGMFKDEHAIDLKTFWIAAHSIHEVSFITAIVLCWQFAPLRNALLVLFGLHFLVRVWTLAYFAPAIMRFQAIANGGSYSGDLRLEALRWRRLNYVRTGLFVGLSIAQAWAAWGIICP